jgi:hypothetical protein
MALMWIFKRQAINVVYIVHDSSSIQVLLLSPFMMSVTHEIISGSLEVKLIVAKIA